MLYFGENELLVNMKKLLLGQCFDKVLSDVTSCSNLGTIFFQMLELCFHVSESTRYIVKIICKRKVIQRSNGVKFSTTFELHELRKSVLLLNSNIQLTLPTDCVNISLNLSVISLMSGLEQLVYKMTVTVYPQCKYIPLSVQYTTHFHLPKNGNEFANQTGHNISNSVFNDSRKSVSKSYKTWMNTISQGLTEPPFQWTVA